MRKYVFRLSISVFIAMGCQREPIPGEDLVPLDQVPAKVMEAAKAKLPDVIFEAAWKEEDGGRIAYEVRGKNKVGKIRDVKVTPDGEILELD